MLTVAENQTQTFELPPAGAHAARCSRIIDLGTQKSTFEGESRSQRKVLITWELAEHRGDGTPFVISRRFGLSLNEKAALRQFLVAWRGRQFTDDELQAFDLRRLAGAPCLLNLVAVERNGKEYRNVVAVSPLPRGMVAPGLVADPIVFEIEDERAESILEQLSEGLQATITASPEWQARKAPPGAILADLDDDIPF
ncbi:MAG: hypothetical protein HT579_21785 [Candidatus Accumulibacter similis]|nr:MAG: hypothetical protein HT579_21785 [Candidatus Accumulibacter similis]